MHCVRFDVLCGPRSAEQTASTPEHAAAPGRYLHTEMETTMIRILAAIALPLLVMRLPAAAWAVSADFSTNAEKSVAPVIVQQRKDVVEISLPPPPSGPATPVPL